MERKFYFLVAIFLTLLIGWGSLFSIGNEMPSKIQISDKIIHSASYFLLTIFWLLYFKKESKRNKIILTIVLIIFIYGIIIEVLQGTVTINRQSEIFDVLANLVGIIIGAAVYKMVFQKKLLN